MEERWSLGPIPEFIKIWGVPIAPLDKTISFDALTIWNNILRRMNKKHADKRLEETEDRSQYFTCRWRACSCSGVKSFRDVGTKANSTPTAFGTPSIVSWSMTNLVTCAYGTTWRIVLASVEDPNATFEWRYPRYADDLCPFMGCLINSSGPEPTYPDTMKYHWFYIFRLPHYVGSSNRVELTVSVPVLYCDASLKPIF